jgi:hypothetical protein
MDSIPAWGRRNELMMVKYEDPFFNQPKPSPNEQRRL